MSRPALTAIMHIIIGNRAEYPRRGSDEIGIIVFRTRII